jgi:hypothetical protein
LLTHAPGIARRADASAFTREGDEKVRIGSQFGWLDIDPCFEALGNCDDERAMRYREFVQSAIPAGEWEFDP